jgi:hypothetical protein
MPSIAAAAIEMTARYDMKLPFSGWETDNGDVFAVASTDERCALDDALIASFSRRHGVKVMGQSDGPRSGFKRVAAYL